MPLSAKALRCLWLMMLVDHQLRSAQFCSHHCCELGLGCSHCCALVSLGNSCCGVSRAVLSGVGGRRARFLLIWRCCCDGHVSQAGSSWCALSPSQTLSSPSHGLHGCCRLSVRSKLWTMMPARVNELSGSALRNRSVRRSTDAHEESCEASGLPAGAAATEGPASGLDCAPSGARPWAGPSGTSSTQQ